MLEGVHRLQHRRDPPHVAVDLGVAEELLAEVRVEPDLHLGRRVDPQGGVEETVVEELFEEQVGRVGGAGDEVLGQLEEGLEEVEGEVLARAAAEQVGDDEEAAAGDDLLLDGGRGLDQLADEGHQFGAGEKRKKDIEAMTTDFEKPSPDLHR